MGTPFVWFDIAGEAAFYRDLFGWSIGPGMGDYEAWITDGEQPWAGVVRADGPGRWVPYVPVDDLDVAAERAVALGGRVVQAKQDGPAGSSVLVADPGGAVVALFVPATL
jgi:predicted enzyme related to lactoylglutathione lyase